MEFSYVEKSILIDALNAYIKSFGYVCPAKETAIELHKRINKKG